MNDIAVCTLFEGHYHFGLGALVNSLHQNGFTGSVWVGYRGSLPPWVAKHRVEQDIVNHVVSPKVTLEFVKLDTPFHFTNYKPQFMLDLLRGPCRDVHAILYFDPDILVKCRWSFFEKWLEHGVALCEDINSPMPANHPLRMMWREFVATKDLGDPNRVDAYYNGGFVGIPRQCVGFLEEWSKIQTWMGPEIGGLERCNVDDRTFAFNKTDQDALNIAVMYTRHALTTMGKEGMDFIPGGWTMAHAIGSPKPWKKSLVWRALMGRKPTSADRLYFSNAANPIPLYSKVGLRARLLQLKIAAALGRYLGS